jgi:signal peptidase I
MVRFLLWVPVLMFIFENFPVAYWPLEGPSMQPTFNPFHTSEKGIINTKDHVLVLKNPSPDTFSYARSLFSDSIRKRADRMPQRGQIYVYTTPHNPNRKSVKRVVAVAGDTITPLEGYPDSTAPVTIPYNHVWLEGDVSDRKRSVDSNTFGPISANLLVGRVLVTLPFLQPWRSGTRWEDAPYPARDRVVESAVRPLDPDEEDSTLAFRDGRASAALDVLKAYPPARPLTPMERERWEFMHRVSSNEKERKDIETYELATALEAELRTKLSGKTITTTLKNVEMSREEFERFQKEGVVPEAVLKRTERS